MTLRLRRAFVNAIAVAVCCVAAPAYAQDTLTDAKKFYESADYEEALKLLNSAPPARRSPEAAAYRVFCLVALGREDEARTGVEAIVRQDPLFRIASTQVSPRLRSFFDEIRTPLLPDIARGLYTRAKAAFDRKEWATAIDEFDSAIELLGEIGKTAQGADDLKFLASNFRDLAKASLEPPKPAVVEPPPAPTTPAAPPKPVEPEIYGVQHESVKKPVSVSKTMPEWRPVGVEERMFFEGILEVVVNEQGKVDSARMLRPAHPRYDAELLKAAMSWTFRPATKDGKPVKYRYALAISLGR